jgi:hypothetical protein
MTPLDEVPVAFSLPAGPLPLPQLLDLAVALAAEIRQIHDLGQPHGAIDQPHLRTNGTRVKLLPPTFAAPRLTACTAPEVLRGAEPDDLSDIFSFGALVYELASGRTPFPAVDDESLRLAILHHDPHPITQLVSGANDTERGLYAALDKLVLRCLSRTRATRTQRIQKVQTELKVLASLTRGSIASSAPADPLPPPAPAPATAEPLQVEPGALILPQFTLAQIGLTETEPEENPELVPINMPCPQCHGPQVYRSRTRTTIETILSGFGFRVCRCHRCFYRFVRLGAMYWAKPSED